MLITSGVVTVNVSMDNVEREIELFVVSDSTMRNSVVLGRDALKKLNLGLRALPPSEAAVMREIFNIDVSEDVRVSSLEINPDIDFKTQKALRKLFFTDYQSPERPENPKVQAQLCLRLTNQEPIYFSPRRMSFNEKEHLQKILDSLVARNVIRVSDSPYASPIVMVRKKTVNTDFVSIIGF